MTAWMDSLPEDLILIAEFSSVRYPCKKSGLNRCVVWAMQIENPMTQISE